MPRVPRRYQTGEYHHVINRGNVRARLFFDDEDYQTFFELLTTAARRFGLPILGYCLMPNHWHLVVQSQAPGDLSRTMHWLTSLHAHAWARAHGREGLGHVYQGRFISVPVQPGPNLCRVLRYVERNALAANLAARAEDWRWSSACRRLTPGEGPALLPQSFLPSTLWLEYLNARHVDHDIREAIRSNLPIGDDDWVKARSERLGIVQRRNCGRPCGKPVR